MTEVNEWVGEKHALSEWMEWKNKLTKMELLQAITLHLIQSTL